MEQHTIKSSIEYILSESKKNIKDIKYVSYIIGNYLQTRQEFYCSYDEFIKIMGDQYMFNLKWLWDIRFVADDWWLTFDMRGDWIMHTIPKQPKNYRVPEVNLLVNNCIDDL